MEHLSRYLIQMTVTKPVSGPGLGTSLVFCARKQLL